MQIPRILITTALAILLYPDAGKTGPLGTAVVGAGQPSSGWEEFAGYRIPARDARHVDHAPGFAGVGANPPAIWSRLRAGFAFPDPQTAGISQRDIGYYLDWYARRPEFVTALLIRGGKYLYYIANEVERRDMPLEIALLPAIESAYKSTAVSASGASGLWQFIPATARSYGLEQNEWYDGRQDLVAATTAALDYLQYLHHLFDGDWFLALSAYNGGEGYILRLMDANLMQDKPVRAGDLPLRSETRRYVPKLLAIRDIVLRPQLYRLSLPDVPDSPYFASFAVKPGTGLPGLAQRNGIDPDEMLFLNEGYRRAVIPPAGPYRVLMPIRRSNSSASSLAPSPAG